MGMLLLWGARTYQNLLPPFPISSTGISGKLTGTGSTGQTPVQIALRNDDIGRGSGISPFIPAVVEGVSAKLLDDSGADITLISQALYDRIRHKHCLPHCDMDNIILKAAGDSILDVKAYVTVGFDINGTIYTWTAFVVPISEDALIGYDFLYHFNCVLEARRGLKLDVKFVNCELAGHIPNVMRVCLQSDTFIPARSEAVIGTYIPDRMLTDGIVIEPLAVGLRDDSLQVGASLVNSSLPTMPVRVMNTSSEDITVCAGTTIGLAHEVNDVIVLDNEDEQNGQTAIRSCHVHENTHADSANDDLHPVVDELYQQNLVNLHTDEKTQLHQKIAENDNLCPRYNIYKIQVINLCSFCERAI